MDPSEQIPEHQLEVCLVVPPRQPVHAGSGVALERVERNPEQVERDMVEERGEPFLPPLPCRLPYAAQRLGHAPPVLRPARALLAHVPLGPRPWLHRLRRRATSGFVRRLHGYYGEVRLLGFVHHRLRLLAFPARTSDAPPAKPKISRFPYKELPPGI